VEVTYVDSLSEKNEIAIGSPPQRPLAQFAAKAVMAGIVAVVSAWIISDIFIGKIANLMDERTAIIEQRIDARIPSKFGGTGIVAIVARELERATNPRVDLTPEAKQKLISDLRIVADRWRPFFIEASSAIVGNPPPPAVPK
jgi:hypothetical protein